jgi:hypothetical protein
MWLVASRDVDAGLGWPNQKRLGFLRWDPKDPDQATAQTNLGAEIEVAKTWRDETTGCWLDASRTGTL